MKKYFKNNKVKVVLQKSSKTSTDDEDDGEDEELKGVVLCELIDPPEDEGELSDGLQSLLGSPLYTNSYYYNTSVKYNYNIQSTVCFKNTSHTRGIVSKSITVSSRISCHGNSSSFSRINSSSKGTCSTSTEVLV